jgi:hypothetical protein
VSSLEAGGICDNLLIMAAYSEHQNETDTMRSLQARAIHDNYIKIWRAAYKQPCRCASYSKKENLYNGVWIIWIIFNSCSINTGS